MPPLKTFTYRHRETERLIFVIETYTERQADSILKAAVKNFNEWKLIPKQ